MTEKPAAKPMVGVLGATSLVGGDLLPLLVDKGWRVTAFSRHAPPTQVMQADVSWLLPSEASLDNSPIPYWVCLAPIWVLPEHFERIKKSGASHIVALSSTSLFTKVDSSDATEQALTRQFADSEKQLATWAEKNGISWTVLRPTLIYGLGRDKNISQIARLIKRFGFFPLLGEAKGLRQPVHLRDVATACIASIERPAAVNRAFNLSGAEVLSYREMVCRIFAALGKQPRLVRVPLWIFRMAVAMMRLLPAFRKWSPAMVERMNRDMVFDHMEATQALNFSPRAFSLERRDLPES